jgi:hypothetical protein
VRGPARARPWTRIGTVGQVILVFVLFGCIAILLSSWRVDIWSRGGPLRASGIDPRLLAHRARTQPPVPNVKRSGECFVTLSFNRTVTAVAPAVRSRSVHVAATVHTQAVPSAMHQSEL